MLKPQSQTFKLAQPAQPQGKNCWPPGFCMASVWNSFWTHSTIDIFECLQALITRCNNGFFIKIL